MDPDGCFPSVRIQLNMENTNVGYALITPAEQLRSGGTAFGLWLFLPGQTAAERLARTGYDYLGIDLQHGLLDFGEALQILTALATADVPGLVRVPGNEAWLIGKVLDAGAAGVIVPMVNTAAEAEAAVAACRYPPAGVRSFGPMRARMYFGGDTREVDNRIARVVMIETAEGLANVRQIASISGVDALYVGPSDLSIALGFQPGTAPTEAFDSALDEVLAAAHDAGIAAGIQCPNASVAASYLARGFRLVTVTSDANLLFDGAERALRDIREVGSGFEVGEQQIERRADHRSHLEDKKS